MKYSLLSATALVAMLSIGATTGAYAAEVWVSDALGNIGEVNTATGAVTNFHATSNPNVPLTDIGFIGGTLYGTDFTNLYTVNTTNGVLTTTGTLTGGGGGMNALVGNGSNLLGASSNSTSLFNITPTGVVTVTGMTQPGTSAGDLTFVGSTLYASEVIGNADHLVNATTAADLGAFHTTGGPVANVFGLATVGGVTYAVAGQDVYTVNLGNGLLTFDSTWAGSGLGQAFGEAAAPGPKLGEGLLGFAAMTALLIGVRYRGLFV